MVYRDVILSVCKRECVCVSVRASVSLCTAAKTVISWGKKKIQTRKKNSIRDPGSPLEAMTTLVDGKLPHVNYCARKVQYLFI